jgi:hypothetical protein
MQQFVSNFVSTSLNIIGIRRIGVICIVLTFYIILSMIIKYVYTMFLMFCVFYTMSDIYKHRRKYIWILKFMHSQTILFIKYSLGDEYADYLQPIITAKYKRKKKI